MNASSASPDASDHEAVYAAERAAFEGTDLEELRPVAGLIEHADRLTSGEWWPAGAVTVRRSRSDAASSTARCRITVDGTIHEIRLAVDQATVATLAHELAHVLAGIDAHHGARFRAAYLDVVAAVTNLDPLGRRGDLHVDQLRDAFAAVGLSTALRAWPKPPGTGPIAL